MHAAQMSTTTDCRIRSEREMGIENVPCRDQEVVGLTQGTLCPEDFRFGAGTYMVIHGCPAWHHFDPPTSVGDNLARRSQRAKSVLIKKISRHVCVALNRHSSHATRHNLLLQYIHCSTVLPPTTLQSLSSTNTDCRSSGPPTRQLTFPTSHHITSPQPPHACPPACILSYLPPYLPTYPLAYLPTCLAPHRQIQPDPIPNQTKPIQTNPNH
ncbi:hypothetical protein IWX49DRAFT_80103 [Phyllosticta citricarpa]|uniref:Uncharacterized protein n=1 Tax=Phyllosticta paracitricarpa TaxID=2016321 RepID=A0ABR1MYX9_9PEZI